MSADLLRRAAAEIRKNQEREENLGHIGGREYAAWFAVAAWLERVADHSGRFSGVLTDDANAVARAYLGESA